MQFKFQNEHSIVIGSNLEDTLHDTGGMLLLPFEKVDLTKVEEIIKIA